MEPDQHRSSITDHIALRDGTLADAEWSSDGSMLAFLSNSRDHKEAILRVADPNTGEVRTVMDEKVETFFESGYRMSNWHILPERNEVIWFSQRSDWGHLYLYDLETGELKQPVTEGDWNVYCKYEELIGKQARSISPEPEKKPGILIFNISTV
jgi:dipeptidyl-peptidase-4